MSAPIAVDFSFERPSVAALVGANVKIAIRYLTGDGKAVSQQELSSYAAAGISVAFVYENTANDAVTGLAGGIAAAHLALESLANLGFSQAEIANIPVYFAVDTSVDPSSCTPYFQGITSVIHPSQVGVYGEGALCSLLEAIGLASWFWQSESTSFPGNASTLPITHLQQVFNQSPVPGTDLDYVCKTDVGQVPRPSPTPGPIHHTPPPPYVNNLDLLTP